MNNKLENFHFQDQAEERILWDLETIHEGKLLEARKK